MRRPQFSAFTWLVIGLSAFIWLVVTAAAISMACGNPTAINTVVGCSIPGVFTTVWAVAFARQDARWRR